MVSPALLIKQLTPAQQLSLYGLTKNGKTVTGAAYRVYCAMAERFQMLPVTPRGFRDHISRLRSLGLIETKVISLGRRGRTTAIRLKFKANGRFIRALLEDMRKWTNFMEEIRFPAEAPEPRPRNRLSWREVKEIRRLREEFKYTESRLAAIYGVGKSTIHYAIAERQSPLKAAIGQHHADFAPRLWDLIAIIAQSRKLPYRGFSKLEVASMVKAHPRPITDAEREILEKVCAGYGMSYEDVPSVERPRKYTQCTPTLIHPSRIPELGEKPHDDHRRGKGRAKPKRGPALLKADRRICKGAKCKHIPACWNPNGGPKTGASNCPLQREGR